MKNRLLPFCLVTAITGLSLFLSVLSMAGQPGTPDHRNSAGSWLEKVRANQVTGTVNPMDVIKARQQAEALRTKSAAGAMSLNWHSAGPDNYSGRVWSAIYDKTDQTGNTLISGALCGGIWKSADLGLTWQQMAVENNIVPSVSSLVQTANGTIYAATGVFAGNTILYPGQGIFTSQNGSAFSLIPGTETNTDFSAIIKLAVDPQSNRLFAATHGGLYYSDNGTTWTKIKSGITSDVCIGSDGTILAAVDNKAYLALAGDINNWTTLTTGAANALPNSGIGWITFAIAPSDVNVMYVSLVGDLDGALLDTYYSADKGSTWSVIFPKNALFEPFVYSYSIGTNNYSTEYGNYSNTMAVSPTDPYQIYLGGPYMWHGVRKSPTGFFNWEQVSIGYYSPWIPNSAPLFHHSYTFSPFNPHQMAVATDGGVSICSITDTTTFKTINKMMNTGEFTSVAFSAQPDYVMGGGPGVGVLAMGYFYPRPNLYEFGVNYPTSGFPLYLPYGISLGTTGGSCEWSNIDSKVSVFTDLYDKLNYMRRREMIDLTYDNDFMIGKIRPIDSTGRIAMHLWESFNFAQSRDSVKIYARVDTIPADTTLWVESACNKFKFPYVTTAPLLMGDSLMIVDPIANRLFFAGYEKSTDSYGIYMTKEMLKFNKTPQYYRIHKDIYITPEVPDPVTALTVSSDLNTLWAGTEKGRLIRVTGLINANDSSTACIDSAACVLTHTVYSFPALSGRHVTSISIDPRNSNNVLVTLGNYGNQDYVFYSQNGGDASPVFTSIQGNLPATPIYSGLIEMHNNNAILGTDFGVYSTTNLGTGSVDWAADQNNIGIDVPVTEIRQQTLKDYHILNYGMIYLSSYGRGLWLDSTYRTSTGIAPGYGSPAANDMLKLNPNPVKDVVTISCTHESAGNIEVRVYDLTGRMVLGTSYGTQPKGTFTATLNVSGLSQGTYIVKAGNKFGKIVKL